MFVNFQTQNRLEQFERLISCKNVQGEQVFHFSDSFNKSRQQTESKLAERLQLGRKASEETRSYSKMLVGGKKRQI